MIESLQQKSASKFAMLSSNRDADNILHKPEFLELRTDIIDLFVNGRMSSSEIANAVEESMQLKPNVSKQTAAGIVRRILKVLIDPELRSKIIGEQHSRSILKHRASVDSAREGWMEDKGYFVWSPEETEIFLRLIMRQRYLKKESRQSKAVRRKEGNRDRKRRRPFSHVLLTKTMNKIFNTDKFTPELTQRKIDRIRTEEKKGTANL